jgi:hypothetical protein
MFKLHYAYKKHDFTDPIAHAHLDTMHPAYIRMCKSCGYFSIFFQAKSEDTKWGDANGSWCSMHKVVQDSGKAGCIWAAIAQCRNSRIMSIYQAYKRGLANGDFIPH